MADTTPITALVIDAGPLIKSTSVDSLLARAKKVYTTPAVIAEIRDAATRSRLETTWLPFIQLRTPKPASVSVVSDFAKRTGDFAVLSVTDLQLLALTYELEVEENGGDWRLRRTPGQKGINGPVPQAKKASGQAAEEKPDGVKEEANVEPAEPAKEAISSSLANTHLSPPSQDPTPADDQASDSDSSDSEGWITASNIHLHKAQSAPAPRTSKPTWPMAVAITTTDFAMQNVLLQMNLHLVSPGDLQRIRSVKTWVLRCHACFKICRDMQKQFCPSCGGATLLRAACSTDSTGVFSVHLKRNMQWNNRGNVFSIPKTQHGSASGKGIKRNLILREDQIEYQREIKQNERQKERDLLDPDYLPGILTGERRDGETRPRVGYGRTNPNQGRSKR
ncbi:20S-pre-rRNA D-site endonuclease nob1 [Maublancomyces gigas]|uniref:20S-pre-rRNA D-site endonuclease NOB1 n=1 Tax=Discina gigas TaxID=1032678 RepID=A0ABR3GJ75_9PEZI